VLGPNQARRSTFRLTLPSRGRRRPGAPGHRSGRKRDRQARSSAPTANGARVGGTGPPLPGVSRWESGPGDRQRKMALSGPEPGLTACQPQGPSVAVNPRITQNHGMERRNTTISRAPGRRAPPSTRYGHGRGRFSAKLPLGRLKGRGRNGNIFRCRSPEPASRGLGAGCGKLERSTWRAWAA